MAALADAGIRPVKLDVTDDPCLVDRIVTDSGRVLEVSGPRRLGTLKGQMFGSRTRAVYRPGSGERAAGKESGGDDASSA